MSEGSDWIVMDVVRPRMLPVLAVVSAGLSFAMAAVVFCGILDQESALALATIGYPVCGLMAGLSLLGGARRRQGRERYAWLLISMGLLVSIVGFLVWGIYDVIYDVPPYPNLSDVFYLSTYVLVIVGVLTVPHSEGGRFARVAVGLDGFIGAVSLIGIMWGLVLAGAIDLDGRTVLESVVSAAYPTLDVLVLVSVLLLWLRQARSRRDVLMLALALAATSTATADLLFLLSTESYVAGVWYDGLWLSAYGLFSLIAFRLTRPPSVSRPGVAQLRFIDMAVTYLAGFGLLIASSYRVATEPGIGVSIKMLLGFTGFVTLAAMGRQALALAEHRDLVELERRDLVASVSHELRTPLTAIQGFVELLADDWANFDEDERETMFDTVRSQTRAVVRIVTDLIEVSRGEITSRKLSVEPFDLRRAVDQAVTASGVDPAKVFMDAIEADVIVADEQRVIQILVNLLTNADRYAGGKMAVEARRSDRDIVIEVHDDGPGVPLRYRERMWERFDRAHHRLDATVPGTGVGLALVRAIAEAHGGYVAYRDSPMLGGACFIVAIPQTV